MNKYRLISKKGQGTFSDVLKAQNIKHKQFVAIKCMKSHYDSIQQVNNLKEIQALKKLSPHPHIVDLLEVLFDEPTGRLALVFELMEQNLYESMERRKPKISEKEVKKIMYQIMKAMYHMHKHGIFHRDIKPENILISDNNVKLADFGSCRNKNSEQPYTEYISTRWYRAPECLLTDGYYNEKMDIWGAGCVMFENLTSTPLFPGKNELDQIHRIHEIVGTPSQELLEKFKGQASHMDINFKPNIKGKGIEQLMPNISNECVDLIKKMLIYDPKERISAKECLKHPFFSSLREREHREHSSSLHFNTSSSKQNIKTNSTLFSVRNHSNNMNSSHNNTNYTQIYTEQSEKDLNFSQYKQYSQYNNNSNMNASGYSVNNTLQSNQKNYPHIHNSSLNGIGLNNSINQGSQQVFSKQNSYSNNNHNHLTKIIKHHSHHTGNVANQHLNGYLNPSYITNNNHQQQHQQNNHNNNSHQEPMFPELKSQDEKSISLNPIPLNNNNNLNNGNNNNNNNNRKFQTSMSDNIEEEQEDNFQESQQKFNQKKENVPETTTNTNKNLPYLKKYHNNNSTSTFISQNSQSNIQKQNNSNNSIQFKILPQTIKRGRIPTIMPSDSQNFYHNTSNSANHYQNSNSNVNINNNNHNHNHSKQSTDLKQMIQFQQLQQQLQQQQSQLGQQKYGKKIMKGRPKQKYVSPYSKKELNKL